MQRLEHNEESREGNSNRLAAEQTAQRSSNIQKEDRVPTNCSPLSNYHVSYTSVMGYVEVCVMGYVEVCAGVFVAFVSFFSVCGSHALCPRCTSPRRGTNSKSLLLLFY